MDPSEGDELLTEFKSQLELSRANLVSPNLTPQLISQFTNPGFILRGQAHFIRGNLETAQKTGETGYGLSRTTNTGHHSLPGAATATSADLNLDLDLVPLNRLEISDLAKNPNKVLWGRYLLCQTISPASKVVGIQFVVADPRGQDAVTLALYNYSTFGNGKSVLDLDFDELLPPGMFIILRNPWFKSTAAGGLSLRCDNPSEVQLIGEKRMSQWFPDVVWSPSTQLMTGLYFHKKHFWTGLSAVEKFQNLKNLGNKAFTDGRGPDALRFYDLCLDYSKKEEEGIILSNKVAALLNMECYHAALTLTEIVLAVDQYQSHEKTIYRKVKALLGLARYPQAVQFLEEKFLEIPQLSEKKDFQGLLESAKFLASRKNLGPTLSQLVSLATKEFTDFPTLPEFIGPLTLSKIEGKGRGIIATKDISPGQLLVCSKSFGYHETPPESGKMYTSLNLTRNVFYLKPGHEQVVSQIANKIHFDPQLGAGFYNLSEGRELGHLNPGDWRNNHVDMKRIDGIVQLNAFGTDERPKPSQNGAATQDKSYTGVWLFPSYFNHSCSEANCVFEVYKTAMIIRAVAPVKKGEELMLPYTSPAKSYEERKGCCAGHEFVCSCRLCKLEAKEATSLSEKRKDILKQLEGMESPSQLRRALGLIKKLVALRKNAPELNYCLLSDQVFGVAGTMFQFGRWDDCIFVLDLMFKMAEKSILWYDIGVKIATNMIGCYVVKRDEEMIRVWIKVVKDLLLKFHGSLEPMRFISPLTVETLKKSFDIDFFV